MAKAKEANETLVKLTDPRRLTHLNQTGAAHMVDISNKAETIRSATAVATLLFSDRKTYEALSSYQVVKGDVIAVARVAAFQAAKKTADLVPLAHPSLHITAMSVDIDTFSGEQKAFVHTTLTPQEEDISLRADKGGVTVTARVECQGKTGVEMEAITAATIGAITMYDMLKAVDKGMTIMSARVIEKRGGKSGDWTWDEQTNKLVRPENAAAHAVAHPSSSPTSRESPGSPRKGSDIDEWNEGLAAEFSTTGNSLAEAPPSTMSRHVEMTDKPTPISDYRGLEKLQARSKAFMSQPDERSGQISDSASNASIGTVPVGQQDRFPKTSRSVAFPERDDSAAWISSATETFSSVPAKPKAISAPGIRPHDIAAAQTGPLDPISYEGPQQQSLRNIDTRQMNRISSLEQNPIYAAISSNESSISRKGSGNDTQASDSLPQIPFTRREHRQHENAARALQARLEKTVRSARPFVDAVGQSFEAALKAETQMQRTLEDAEHGKLGKGDTKLCAETTILPNKYTWPGHGNHHLKKVDSKDFQEKRFQREWENSIYGKGSWVR